MKKASFTFLFVLACLVSGSIPVFALETGLKTVDPKSVGSTIEVHISDDGKMILQGAQVMQIAGSTFYARTSWGSSYMRWTIRTDEKTLVTRRFDTEASVPEIKVGDIISAEGEFLAGSDSISLVARKIKDWSLTTDKAEFAGIITALATSTTAFDIKTAAGNKITVALGASTSMIKGVIGISFDKLFVGDKITSAVGVFEHVSKVLSADKVLVHQDKTIFKPKNFEGTIRSISGSALPATLVVTIGGKDYTVELPANTEVLNRKKAPASLKRFFTDDTVRFYGAIKQDNLTTIVAEVVRNLDL